MPDTFTRIEARIVQFGERFPAMPVPQVVAWRLQDHVHARIEAALDLALEPHALNARTWTVLAMIYAQPDREVKPSDVSTVVAASRAHVTRLVDDLEKRGLVLRRASDTDRRVSVLRLTPAGSRLVRAVLPTVWSFHESLWSGSSAREMSAYTRTLRRLLARVQPAEKRGRR